MPKHREYRDDAPARRVVQKPTTYWNIYEESQQKLFWTGNGDNSPLQGSTSSQIYLLSPIFHLATHQPPSETVHNGSILLHYAQMREDANEPGTFSKCYRQA